MAFPRQEEALAKSEKAATKNKHWLHRDLRVRFIDKLHKGGRYYNTKVGPHSQSPSFPRDWALKHLTSL